MVSSILIFIPWKFPVCWLVTNEEPISSPQFPVEKYYWLVVWDIFFPYIGNKNPNWLSCFSEQLKSTTKSLLAWFSPAWTPHLLHVCRLLKVSWTCFGLWPTCCHRRGFPVRVQGIIAHGMFFSRGVLLNHIFLDCSHDFSSFLWDISTGWWWMVAMNFIFPVGSC